MVFKILSKEYLQITGHNTQYIYKQLANPKKMHIVVFFDHGYEYAQFVFEQYVFLDGHIKKQPKE
jgi:hypothetical protein